MQAQSTFVQAEFASRAFEIERLEGTESLQPEAAAMQDERERRRMEFRSSLLRARAAQVRLEGRAIAKHALRQLSAGFGERGPAHILADMAGAR